MLRCIVFVSTVILLKSCAQKFYNADEIGVRIMTFASTIVISFFKPRLADYFAKTFTFENR